MNTWMIFERDSDGAIFFWNGEHPIMISPKINARWHHEHGKLPSSDQTILKKIMESRLRNFKIAGYGTYRVHKRGFL